MTLEKEALQLSDRLPASLSRKPAGLADSWLREADDRMKAFHDGMIEAVTGSEALENIRRELPSKI